MCTCRMTMASETIKFAPLHAETNSDVLTVLLAVRIVEL
eukprot:COSAG06_NODE_58424_length_277_cov_0.578652_1_plen_38_part_10